MHPTLARYLDPEAARTVLLLAESGEAIPEEHRHLVAAAKENPVQNRLVVKATGKKLDAEAQQAVLFLATYAALRALEEEPSTKGMLEETKAALRELGAEASEVDAMLAQVVADEAFGTDQDPGRFDVEWFGEALVDLPKLAALEEEEEAHRMIADFAKQAPQGQAMLYESAAGTLLEAAWSEGASPVTIEHVEDALDAIAEQVEEALFPRAAVAVALFIELLNERGLMGDLRAERLSASARSAAKAGISSEEEDEP